MNSPSIVWLHIRARKQAFSVFLTKLGEMNRYTNHLGLGFIPLNFRQLPELPDQEISLKFQYHHGTQRCLDIQP